jgi:hypothetical protein
MLLDAYFAEYSRKTFPVYKFWRPVQIRAQQRYNIWASFIHGGLFLFTKDFFCSPIGTVAGFINSDGTKNHRRTMNIQIFEMKMIKIKKVHLQN